jgi:hypothetical protein
LRTDKNDVHFMQFVRRTHRDIDQSMETVYGWLCVYVVLRPFPWKRSHTFRGGAVPSEGYTYNFIHVVKGKRPRYGRDKGNKR